MGLAWQRVGKFGICLKISSLPAGSKSDIGDGIE